MRTNEHKHCSNLVWGIMISLFGVFFLIANLTSVEVLRYWPIFLIVAGAYKAACGWLCHAHKEK